MFALNDRDNGAAVPAATIPRDRTRSTRSCLGVSNRHAPTVCPRCWIPTPKRSLLACRSDRRAAGASRSAVPLIEDRLFEISISTFGEAGTRRTTVCYLGGRDCAIKAHPVSCLGEYHLRAQRLHPSAQRQSARLRRGARGSGLPGVPLVGTHHMAASGRWAVWEQLVLT